MSKEKIIPVYREIRLLHPNHPNEATLCVSEIVFWIFTAAWEHANHIFCLSSLVTNEVGIHYFELDLA